MLAPKTFTVTEEHLALLPHQWFDYHEDYEFGAAGVDQKRPYGNSDVYGDIAEHLGIEGDKDSWGDEYYTPEQQAHMLKVHQEMATVLNILVRNGQVAEGEYKASAYGQDWTRVYQ